MKQPSKVKSSPIPHILTTVALAFGYLSFFSARWFVSTYGRLGFDSILFTLTSELGGVQSGLILRYLLKALLPASALTRSYLGPTNISSMARSSFSSRSSLITASKLE